MKTITATNDYSILVIVKDSLTESEIKVMGVTYAKAIKRFGATELAITSKGRENLAYPIKGNLIAKFLEMNFTIYPNALPELAKVMKLDDNILRYLTIRKNSK